MLRMHEIKARVPHKKNCPAPLDNPSTYGWSVACTNKKKIETSLKGEGKKGGNMKWKFKK